jgi:hypothetical protein
MGQCPTLSYPAESPPTLSAQHHHCCGHHLSSLSPPSAHNLLCGSPPSPISSSQLLSGSHSHYFQFTSGEPHRAGETHPRTPPLTPSVNILTRARHWRLTSVILATQEAEIRRIEVQSQPKQVVQETLSQKSPSQKRAGGVAQGVGPEFKP